MNTFEGGAFQLPQDEQGLPIDEDITGVVPPRCSTVQLYHGGTVEDITGWFSHPPATVTAPLTTTRPQCALLSGRRVLLPAV